MLRFFKTILLTYIGLSALLIVYLNVDQERYILKQQVLPQSHTFHFDAPFQEIHFTHPDGTTTNALYFPVKRAKGAVLYLHGRGGNLATYWGYMHGDFTSRGYSVIIPDYRGFGKSTGTPSETRCHEDASICYNFLKERFSETKISVYGISFGSGVATHLASKTNPARLILEAPYYSMLDLIPQTAPWLPPYYNYLIVRYTLRTDLWIKNVSCPIYIFHGNEDALIPMENSKRLLKHIKGRFDYTVIPKGTHNFLSRHPEYQTKLSKILN